jgi:hypothetical protein
MVANSFCRFTATIDFYDFLIKKDFSGDIGCGSFDKGSSKKCEISFEG